MSGAGRAGSRVLRGAVLTLLGTAFRAACPPGVDPVRFGRALAEDVADVLGQLSGVDTLIAAVPSTVEDARSVAMPGTPVIEALSVADLLARLAALGYTQAALFTADAPDLPALLAAKPFSGLSTSDAAVVPSSGAGLVALATRLPPPPWLPTLDLDTPDALHRLRAAAPAAADLAVAPAWRRLRTPTDVATLDPALEGWEATRALLSRG
jgi:hypothetical protein